MHRTNVDFDSHSVGGSRPNRVGRAGRSSLASGAPVGEHDRMGGAASGERQVRILIADPGETSRRAIARVIENDGRFCVCAEAADAAEAVAMAIETVPDICLLEVALPGGGLAAAWELTSRLPATPVVVLTSREDDAEFFAALEMGVAGYLLKGAVLDWLPNTLIDVCRGTFAMPRHLATKVVRQLRTTEPRRRAVVGTRPRLTSREWEVLHLIASGLSTRQVAERLTLSATAVRVHIAAAVRKLGVASRAEAVALFTRSGQELEAAGLSRNIA
jgi:DNA-binding NarL/FixJ family response regulator